MTTFKDFMIGSLNTKLLDEFILFSKPILAKVESNFYANNLLNDITNLVKKLLVV